MNLINDIIVHFNLSNAIFSLTSNGVVKGLKVEATFETYNFI